MSEFGINDDFFSPIRCTDTFADSSEDSECLDISNSESSFSFTNAQQNKFEDDAIAFKGQIEVQIKAGGEAVMKTKSGKICTQVSNKISSDSLNTKKLDKIKHFKDKNVQKEYPSKNLKYLEQKDLKTKSSKSLSPIESAQCNRKDIKEVRSTTHSLKNMCIADKKAAVSNKHSFKNKPIDKSLDSNVKDLICQAVKSCESKKTNAVLDSESQKSCALIKDVEGQKYSTNPSISQYEASIEKIIHDCVTLECDKIRQNIYAQQMSFYKQINKIKEEMEERHLATNGRLFKLIKELMLVNASLKPNSQNVKKC